VSLRAIIFDYGKVLSQPADADDHDELVANSGLPSEIFDPIYWRLRDHYDSGELTAHAYFQQIVTEGGGTHTPASIAAMINADNRMWTHLNEPMVAWALSLKRAGYKLGILSNLGNELVAYLLANFNWLKEFDHLTWSSNHSIVKPQPEIYLLTAAALEVEPEEALFLDDKEVNIQGAQATGMNGLLFTTIEDLPTQLANHELAATLNTLSE
jgi:putative hydrolase of the HAD superfamily